MIGGIGRLQRRCVMAPFVVAVIVGAGMLLPGFMTRAHAADLELPSSAIVGPSAVCAGGTWNVSWSLQNRDARPVEVTVKVDGTAVAFTANPVQPGQTATASRQFPATGFQGSLAQSVAYVGAQGAVSTSRLDLPYCSLPTTTRPPKRPVSIETFPQASVPVPVPQATTAKPTAPPTTALVTTTATSSTSTTTTAVAEETTTTSESTTTTEVVPGTALRASVGSVPGTQAAVVPVTVAVDATPVASSGPGPWLWVAAAILAAGIVSAAAIGLRRRT